MQKRRAFKKNRSVGRVVGEVPERVLGRRRPDPGLLPDAPSEYCGELCQSMSTGTTALVAKLDMQRCVHETKRDTVMPKNSTVKLQARV